MYGLLFALLSPIIFGLMNVWEKYVLSHRVKSTLGYTLPVAIANISFAVIVGSFLSWSGISWTDALFPALAGMLLAAQIWVYYPILQKEDVSHILGFAFLYPILVALLSFLFLNEKLTLWAYVGASLTILGVLLLSIRAKQARFQAGALYIALMIILIALNEFFVKVSTSSVNGWHGVVISNTALGVALLFGLLHPAVRAGARSELHNIHWAFMGEALTFGAVLTLYLAMAELPATIVSSVAAIQPLAALVFEWIAHRSFGGITKDEGFLPKLGAILLIVAGVALMYLTV
jgi:drug/metabolite transporter (DMT)-like permease